MIKIHNIINKTTTLQPPTNRKASKRLRQPFSLKLADRNYMVRAQYGALHTRYTVVWCTV